MQTFYAAPYGVMIKNVSVTAQMVCQVGMQSKGGVVTLTTLFANGSAFLEATYIPQDLKHQRRSSKTETGVARLPVQTRSAE